MTPETVNISCSGVAMMPSFNSTELMKPLLPSTTIHE